MIVAAALLAANLVRQLGGQETGAGGPAGEGPKQACGLVWAGVQCGFSVAAVLQAARQKRPGRATPLSPIELYLDDDVSPMGARLLPPPGGLFFLPPGGSCAIMPSNPLKKKKKNAQPLFRLTDAGARKL